MNSYLYGLLQHPTLCYSLFRFNLYFLSEMHQMLKSPNIASKTRLWVFYTFVVFVHFLIIARFFKIQILDNEKYSKRAQSNYVRALSVPAPRGLILDRNGEIIVDNYPTYVLYAIGAEVKIKIKITLLSANQQE